MQFPRYELVILERELARSRPRPARHRSRVWPRLRWTAPRHPPPGRIDIHQYLELEFTVDDRR